MKLVHVVLALTAASVLAGGLTGCRAFRRSAPQQAAPQAQVPAQGAYAPTYPSYPPPPTTYSSPGAVISSTGPSTGTTTRIVRPAPPPMSDDWGGSPDGGMGTPAFPPSGPPLAATDATPVISGTIQGSARIDNELANLSDRIRELDQKISQPAETGQPAAGEPSLAGASAARAFADRLRSTGKADVSVNGSTVVVRMTDAFQAGSDQLRKDAALKATLLATAEALQTTAPREVLVVGHSDGQPIKKSKWPSNKALSQARAQTVAAELSKNGVRAGQLQVIGRGFEEPLVAKENGSRDQARNRRVEVLVRF